MQELEIVHREVHREADILFFGDPNFTCRHPGNLSFVQCVNRCVNDYHKAGDIGKLTICNGIVEGLAARNPPARFLMRDNVSMDWVKLSKSDAIVVTAHAFVTLVFQEEEERIQFAMLVNEIASDPPQESNGPPTFEPANDGEADDPFRNRAGGVNNAGRANGDGASTLYTVDNVELDSSSVMDVRMNTEVDDAVMTTTQREADFTSRQLARRVSIDCESTSFVTEVQCDFVKQLPIRRRVSDSSESDTTEPISDDGQHSDGFWEGLNTRDFDDLKDVLGCDEESLLS